jgi:hypothetical protein
VEDTFFTLFVKSPNWQIDNFSVGKDTRTIIFGKSRSQHPHQHGSDATKEKKIIDNLTSIKKNICHRKIEYAQMVPQNIMQEVLSKQSNRTTSENPITFPRQTKNLSPLDNITYQNQNNQLVITSNARTDTEIKVQGNKVKTSTSIDSLEDGDLNPLASLLENNNSGKVVVKSKFTDMKMPGRQGQSTPENAKGENTWTQTSSKNGGGAAQNLLKDNRKKVKPGNNKNRFVLDK